MDETDHWALEHFQNLLSGTSSTSHCFASGCHPSSNHVNGSTSTASSSKDQGKVYSTHHASIPNDIELIKFLERHKVDEVLGELVFDDAGRMHSDVLSRKRRSKEDHEGGRKKRRSLEAFLDQERGDGGGSRCPFSR